MRTWNVWMRGLGLAIVAVSATGCGGCNGNQEFEEDTELAQESFDERGDGAPITYTYQFLDGQDAVLNEGEVSFGADYNCDKVSYQGGSGGLFGMSDGENAYCTTPGTFDSDQRTPTLFSGWTVELFSHEHGYDLETGEYIGTEIDVHMKRGKREDFFCYGALSDASGELIDPVEIECINQQITLVLSPLSESSD